MTEKKKNITERIQSFEDARQATGRPEVPDFSNVPEDMREYFEAQYKLAVITEALNEEWKPNWADGKQKKYLPWFWHKPDTSSGFAFYDTIYNCSVAYAGDASRLCFKDSDLAAYAGRQFIDLWNVILLK